MQRPQVVAHFLIPPDEQTPEAIHPAMRAFDNPPPGFEAHLLLERLGFVPSRPDMRGQAKLWQPVSHLVIVIAFLQAQSLRCVGGRAALRRYSRWSPVPS